MVGRLGPDQFVVIDRLVVFAIRPDVEVNTLVSDKAFAKGLLASSLSGADGGSAGGVGLAGHSVSPLLTHSLKDAESMVNNKMRFR